jgi:TPR repeat protein
MKRWSILCVVACGTAATTPTTRVAAPPPADAAGAPAQSPSPSAPAAPPDAEPTLDLAESAFESNQHELAIMTALAVCERGDGEGCLRAARYMEQKHFSERAGRTAAQHRARAIAMFEQGCAADRGDACFRFGRLLFQGKHAPKDEARGLELSERGCALKTGEACVFLASVFDKRSDAKRALDALERGCAANNAHGCTLLGDRVKDRARAFTLYAKACEGRDPLGCARHGTEAKRAKNLVAAIASFEVACELDHRASCLDAARLRETGKGIVDLPKARELYAHACDASVGAACLGLAAMLAAGRGGERNWGEAVDRAHKACRLATPRSCDVVKRLVRSPPDWKCSTENDCKRLCDEMIGKSCTKLGRLIARSAETCEVARDAFRDGCARGDAAACILVGNTEGRKPGAQDAYGKGCALGDPMACALDAFLALELGESREELARLALEKACKRHKPACVWDARKQERGDLARTQRRWANACDRNDARACRLLAQVHGDQPIDKGGIIGLSGDGATPAQERAAAKIEKERRRLFAKACTLGDIIACERAFEPSEAGDAARDARKKQLEANDPCGLDGIIWEQP